MATVVCAKHSVVMIPDKNGVPVITTYEDGRPYCWQRGDRYACGYGCLVITGLSDKMFDTFPVSGAVTVK